VAGTQDQSIGAGAGIDVAEFVLDSGLVAAGYQWYKDGLALPGEESAMLGFAGVGAAEYGVYHCEGSGGEVSRTISILESADPSDAPPAAIGATLAQNHPNPFNPATRISFSLSESGPVRLSVFDVAGREVDVLIDGILSAGDHSVEWRPEGFGSGIYLYRLSSDGGELVRKCSLLK